MGRKRKTNPTPIKLLTVAEIARHYDFHPNTVRTWVTRDELRCYRPRPGGKIYIREDDLLDFLIRNYGI